MAHAGILFAWNVEGGAPQRAQMSWKQQKDAGNSSEMLETAEKSWRPAKRCWKQQKRAGDQQKEAGNSRKELEASKKMLETAPEC
jgi:dsDNA-binding SOS-regulon protein